MYKLIFTLSLIVSSLCLSAQDKYLSKYISYGLENNPFLKSEYLKYQASIEMINSSNSLDDPTISTGIFLSPIETRLGTQRAKISIAQKLPWFGTLKAKQERARVNSTAMNNDYINSKNKFVYSIKALYYDIHLVRNNITYTKKRIDILNKLEQQSIHEFETNKAGMLKILYIQMLRDELEEKTFSYIENNKNLNVKFNLLLNRDKDKEVVTIDNLTYSMQELNTSQTHQNVKIRQIEAQIESAILDEKLQEIKSKPNIILGIDYAIIEKRHDMNPANNGQDAIMPMIKMNIPLWGKKNKSLQKKAALTIQKLEAKKTDVINKLEIEYTNSISKYKIAINKTLSFDKLIGKSEIALKIMNTKYANSENGYDELLNMEQKILIYQLKNISAQVEAIKSLSYIEYLESKQ